MEDDRPGGIAAVGGEIEDMAVEVVNATPPVEQVVEEEGQQQQQDGDAEGEENEDHRDQEKANGAGKDAEQHENKEDAEQEDTGKEQEEDISFPKSLLKRLVKEQMDQRVEGKDGADVQVNKDSLLAFDVAAKLFIHYLTCAANDLCMEAKRQTLGVEDVFQGLEDTDFGEFVEPLRASLSAFKEAKKKGKRKSEEVGVVPDDVHKSLKTDNDAAQ